MFMLNYQSSRLTALLLFILLLLSLFLALHAFWRYKLPFILKALNILIFIFIIYGLLRILLGEQIVTILGNELKPSAYLQNILTSLLPIYAFYLFTRKGQLTTYVIRFWYWFFFAIAIFTFNQYDNRRLQELLELGSSITEFTNNYGYLFLCLIPGLSFFPKKIMQYLGIALCMFYVMGAYKRGAIILCAICFIYFIYFQLVKSSSRKKWIVFLLSGLTIIYAMVIVDDALQNSSYFNNRLEMTLEGDSNGREFIYTSILDAYQNDKFFYSFILGHGADSTVALTGSKAHNDWLEILYNQGILGILAYLLFWYSFYMLLKASKIVGKEVHLALSLVGIVMFGRSLFSMSYADTPIFCSIVLGYCIGVIDNKKLKNTI